MKVSDFALALNGLVAEGHGDLQVTVGVPFGEGNFLADVVDCHPQVRDGGYTEGRDLSANGPHLVILSAMVTSDMSEKEILAAISEEETSDLLEGMKVKNKIFKKEE